MSRFLPAARGILALLAADYFGCNAAAAASRTASDVSTQFNQTGHGMTMMVPLSDSGRTLGDVVLRVEKDDTIIVSRLSLLFVLKDEGTAEVVTHLASLPEMIPLSDLKLAGLDVSFDRQAVALIMGLTASQRKTGELSLGPLQPAKSNALAKPARASGYLNLFAESAYLWKAQETALRFDTEAVLRVGDAVFETEFALENQVNSQLCPSGVLCIFDHTGGLKRHGSRFVYDVPELQDRLTLGDVHTNAATFQRGPDIAGITIEHNPSKLNPTQSIRGTSTQSFVLERAAAVDVLVNGAVAQRLHLPPGSYNLRDLPLRAGANDVTLLITEDAGGSRTLTFSTFSSYSLLSAGKSEWSVTAGVPSYFVDDKIDYLSHRYLASAFARYGLTSALTLEVHAQSDSHVVMGGVGGIWATVGGVFGVNIAASQSDDAIGFGGAVRATWDIAGKDNIDNLRLSSEWHTDEFRTPGQLQIIPTGIIAPVYDYKASFSGSYSRDLGQEWQAAFTARYDLENTQFVTTNPLVAHGDRYHVDFGLSHPIFDSGTISATIGYSNEIYNRSISDFSRPNIIDTKGEIWGGLRFFWRPRDKALVTAASDTLNKRSLTTGSYQSAAGVDSWATSVSVTDDRVSQATNLGGDVTYRGQRAEVTVGHETDLRTGNYGLDGVGSVEERSRVRVGTALVFADDAFAVSAPLRGDGGFAILSPHETIKDHMIIAGTPEYLRAKSDGLGPAVATGLATFSPQTLPVDVSDLPLGYSLGASGFDLIPTYKAGYKLQVGSGYSVSALGELLDGEGKPLALVSGIASNGARQVTVFTNRGGKFAADGLAPGDWKLTMETDGGTFVYYIHVPEGTQGLLRLGTLTPGKD